MKTLHLLIITTLSVMVFTNISIGFAQIMPVPEFQTASFKGYHGTYQIPYNIVNGTVVSTLLDLPAKALLFEINTTSNGQLTVELPRVIIDSKNGSEDASYFVSIYDIKSLGGPTKITPEEINGSEMRILQINFPKDITEIEIAGTFFVEKYHYAAPNSMSSLSPLKQYDTGLAAKDVTCKSDFQLVIKTNDGSPACVKPQTVQKLVERGWGTYLTSNSSQKQFPEILSVQPKRITGLENDTGIVTLENMTYYFETPNYYTEIDDNPVQTLFFHDVVFTLAPQSGEKSLIDGCERENYWTNAKFSDGTSELLYIYVDSQPCPVHFPQISFSTHTNPKAGLTYYDGKMKLLVSTNITNPTEHLVTSSTNQISNAVNKTSTITKLTVHYYGGSGSIHIGSDKFNQTVFFTGNVGQVKAGLPVQVSISDPYDMFIRKYTIPSNEIAQDGSFIFTHTFLGRYDQDIYTLDFSYSDQKYELKYNPIVPP